MAYFTYDLNLLRKRFHDKSVNFNNFADITDKDIERIKDLIAIRTKRNNEKPLYDQNSGLANYIAQLNYLTSPTIIKDLYTFDEKALYFILTVDPELKMLQSYLTSRIIYQTDIDLETDPAKNKELRRQKIAGQEEYEEKARNALGFYDPKLTMYERVFIKKLLKTEGFLSDIKVQSIPQMLRATELVKSLDRINEETLNRLKKEAERWTALAKDPRDLNSLAFNLLNNYEKFGIKNMIEQVLLFMLIADPELNLLRIYEEESKAQMIEQRSIEEMGFYGKGLINVERLYHNKFEPERKISAWTI